MPVDYLSKVDTLQGALDQFRTVSRSTVDPTVLKGKLSQLCRVPQERVKRRSVNAHEIGN